MRTGKGTARERPRRWRARGTALIRSAEDAEAFHEFYAANAQRVVTFFSHRSLNTDVACDLAAETFAIALQRRRQFRGGTDAEAEAWLFAIARSQLSHYWRRSIAERRALALVRADPPSLAQSELDRIEELAGVLELRRRVRRAIAELNALQAYAVTQRIVEERGYAELAQELGVSQDVVRARVSRGLRTLAVAVG